VFLNSHPDFAEVVGTATPSAALKAALDKDAALAMELTRLSQVNPAAASRFAYAIAKPEYERMKQPAPNPVPEPTPDSLIANANRVMPSVAVAGASAINRASQIAAESRQDFEARVAEVKRGA
jgi:hypothetical protein